MATDAFISYSHADDKALERLHKHMVMLTREGKLNEWTDHVILPGDTVDDKISAQLEKSGLFIALLSPDYLASKYCYETEFARAVELAEAGKLRIVPIILEPCDWLNSPFHNYKGLPKDGKAVSEWTNPNNAYLDIVTGLRRVLTEPPTETTAAPTGIAVRKPRVKQDFDSIQKSDFAEQAYETIRDYFQASCSELNTVEDLRAKFEVMNVNSFTCTVVNRAKRSGGEANITVTNNKQSQYGMNGIQYLFEKHATGNSSNGGYQVAVDDYNMFLTGNAFSAMNNRRDEDTKLSPKQAAEELWNNFVKKAGVEYD